MRSPARSCWWVTVKNGVLISQVAEYRAEKIEKLAYLAAVLARDSTAAVDYVQLDKKEVLGLC